MYDRSSATNSIDAARLELFSRKQRSYDSILPTQAALIQHIKRGAYQAGCIWGQATICQMEINSSEDWGWKKQDDMWQIFWTALPPIANSLRSVVARLNVVAGAVLLGLPLVLHILHTALIFLAQLCGAAIATAKIY